MSLGSVLQKGLVIVALGCLGEGAAACAQDAAGKLPSYDVVSIKPNKGGDGRMMINQGQDRYAGTNVSLKMMLRYAYQLTTDDQISGLTGAMNSANFDVEAKMDAETVAALKAMPKDDSGAIRRKMMQAMLEERFHLKVHHEIREMPVYELVVAKGGTKLKEADPNAKYETGINLPKGASSGAGMMMVGPGMLTGQGIPLQNMDSFLAQVLHRQIVDKTGLKGKYDIQLQWQPDDMPSDSKPASGADQKPSLTVAIEEQLGLKLNSVKGPVDTIVVDHAELPTEN